MRPVPRTTADHFALAHTSNIFFFCNDPAPTETPPLPLHDALPICEIAHPRRLHEGYRASAKTSPGHARAEAGRMRLREADDEVELGSRHLVPIAQACM